MPLSCMLPMLKVRSIRLQANWSITRLKFFYLVSTYVFSIQFLELATVLNINAGLHESSSWAGDDSFSVPACCAIFGINKVHFKKSSLWVYWVQEGEAENNFSRHWQQPHCMLAIRFCLGINTKMGVVWNVLQKSDVLSGRVKNK